MSKLKYILLGFLVGILLFFVLPYFVYDTIALFGYDELARLLPSGTIVFYFCFLFLAFLIVNILRGNSPRNSFINSILLIVGALAALAVLLFSVFGSFGGRGFI